MLKKLSVLALVSWFSVYPASTGDVIRIHNDWGGRLDSYLMRITPEYFTNNTVVVTGVCASACTMWLSMGLDRICTTENSYWGFHMVYDQRTGKVSPTGTYTMTLTYPTSLKTWFDKTVKGRDLVWLSGETMINNGWISKCK